MKVSIVYRNYKPLHNLYHSLINNPPKEVSYTLKKPIKRLRIGHKIYRRVGDNPLVKWAINAVQNLIFMSGIPEDTDIIHFIQILPKKIPNIPYVISLEHLAGLGNFVKMDEPLKNYIREFLMHANCKKILPVSIAARDSLKPLFPGDFEKIFEKTVIDYPSIPEYYREYKDKVDYSLIKKDDSLKLLFVGNDIYRKGLHELLEAVKVLNSNKVDISLAINSNADEAFKLKYDFPNVKYYEPVYSRDEMMTKFFLPSDLLILPTHLDTFGMVILEALSAGTPVITTKQFAIPEFVDDGENGLFVKAKILCLHQVEFMSMTFVKNFMTDEIDYGLVKDLVEKITYLYENRDVLKKMKVKSIKEFKPGGKFSIERRNQILLDVYNDALKK